MNAISELYQEMIVDHAKSPKNFGELADKTHHAHGDNPLCGDTIDVDLKICSGHVQNIGFSGHGCAISQASASLMTESIKGKSLEQVSVLFNQFHQMLTSEQSYSYDMGKLAIFEGVKQFPTRVKCATLCWHTLNAALNNHYQACSE